MHRAATTTSTTMIVSNASSFPFPRIAEAAGGPLWYQLYARPDWENTSKLVKRVKAAGCPVLVFTIDLLARRRNTVTNERGQALEGVHPPTVALAEAWGETPSNVRVPAGCRTPFP